MQTSTTTSTSSSTQSPTPLRVINGFGNLIRKTGVKIAQLSVDQVLDSAAKKTNIKDTDLSNISGPLEILIDSLNKTDQLTLVGRVLTKQLLTDLVSNNIRIDAEIKANPEILNEKINKPLFILGFPRTGTTLLHNLLAHPPRYRFPYMWEALCPSIYPDTRKAHSPERIKNAKMLVKTLDYMSPSLKSIHTLYPEGPDECLKLIENSLTTPHMPLYFHIPEYWDWFRSVDSNQLLDVYGYYKKQLQLLQWHGPKGSWVLKTPIHLYFVPELLKTFPDAQIIQLHRDPNKAVASFCSLVAACRRLYSDSVSLDDVGEYVIDFLSRSAQRAMDTENESNSNQFRHINYNDLIKSPEDEIAGICSQFDYEYTDEVHNGISKWLTKNPKNKHGVHKYSLEQYGLSDEIVSSRLQDYIGKYYR